MVHTLLEVSWDCISIHVKTKQRLQKHATHVPAMFKLKLVDHCVISEWQTLDTKNTLPCHHLTNIYHPQIIYTTNHTFLVHALTAYQVSFACFFKPVKPKYPLGDWACLMCSWGMPTKTWLPLMSVCHTQIQSSDNDIVLSQYKVSVLILQDISTIDMASYQLTMNLGMVNST